MLYKVFRLVMCGELRQGGDQPSGPPRKYHAPRDASSQLLWGCHRTL